MADDLIGKYRLLKHLATGQDSQVYQVEEVVSHRNFAMKLLLPEKENDPACRKLLLHDGKVGTRMAHPNVVRVIEVCDDPKKKPYFVMEFFLAGSLRARMLRKEWDFIREHFLAILKQSATGLAFMNAQGWVHRDVKPDNMLVNSVGELKLIDFALAYKPPTGFAAWFSSKGKTVGTRSYMSPEQIRGSVLDGRADIYSYAASAYEVVAGRPPFRGATSSDLLQKHLAEKPLSPATYHPDLTKEFCDLILRMLAKKREDRPKDFHEVLMAIRNIKVFKTGDKPAWLK